MDRQTAHRHWLPCYISTILQSKTVLNVCMVAVSLEFVLYKSNTHELLITDHPGAGEKVVFFNKMVSVIRGV